MSNRQLKEKIRKYLAKSGFLLEHFCRQKLLENAFGLSSSQYFVDKDGITREIDAEGIMYTHWKKNAKEYDLWTILFVECKKSDTHPWVFIWEPIILPSMNCYCDSKTLAKDLKFSFLKKGSKHHYRSLDSTAKNYVVALTKPGSRENRQIYDSMINLIRYHDFSMEKMGELRQKGKASGSTIGTIVQYLTIVYEGSLFLEKTDKKNIEVEEVKHVICYISQQMETISEYRYYCVDIVHKSYFDKFLRIIRNDHKITERLIKSKIK